MNKEFLKELKTITDNITALEEMGVEEDSTLYTSQIQRLVDLTETASDNEFDKDMEGVAGKIPDVESLVKDDEVSEYKKKTFEALDSLTSEDVSYENCPHNDECFCEVYCHGEYDEEEEEEEEEEQEYVTDEEVRQAISDMLSLLTTNKELGADYQAFAEALYMAIDKVISTGARSLFYVPLGGETLEGAIYPHDGGFRLTLDNSEFTLTSDMRESGVEGIIGVPDEEPSLVEQIKDTETEKFMKDTEYLSAVEERLNSKKEKGLPYTDEDYDLMRYYLKQFNSVDNSIEEVSNRGLELAWNYRYHTRTYK